MTVAETTPVTGPAPGPVPAGPAVAGWLLLAIVALVPAPLGAARPWAAALLGCLLALALVLWALARLRDPMPLRIGLRRLAWPALLYGLVALWGWWQTLPLVPHAWIHPLWFEAAALLGPLPGTISLTPLAGRDAVMQLLAYAAAFFLALQYGRDAGYAWRMIGVIAVSSALYAGYGLFNVLSGLELIGPLEKWAYRGLVTGMLVNPNHFATLSGFGLLCCLALFSQASRRPARLFWGSLIALLTVALIFTQSRAGMFSIACGAILLLAIMARKQHSRLLAHSLVLLLAIGMVGLLALDGDDTASWLGSADHRLQVQQLTILLIAERPWLGTGLGSFQDAFGAVRMVGMVPNWNAAHNTYLELALELGLPAALTLLGVEAWLVWRCFHGALRRRRHWLICAVAFAASLQLGLHSLLDFSAQIPAVATCWAVLLGLGVAQSWSSRQRIIPAIAETAPSAAGG